MVPYLFNTTSATPLRRYKQHSRGGRGCAEISNFSLHHTARLPSKPFFTTFCLAVTQHHHDEGWAAHLSPLSFSSFQFPQQFASISAVPGCPAWGPSSLASQAAMHFLAYITLKSLPFSLIFALHWLSPNEYSSSSLDLLNPPKKPAMNPHPYWLLRWCFVSSAQAPSHRKHHTIFCFSYPHTFKISIFSCRALPKAVTCIFLRADLPEPPWNGNTARFTWVFFLPVYSIYQPRNTKRRCTPRYNKRF